MSLGEILRTLGESIPRDHFRQTNSQQLLRECVLAGLNPSTVLDFGCGDGRSIDLFRQVLPRAKWVGVDVDSSPEVGQRSRTDGAFVTYDGRALPFASNSFDLVYSHQVMEHVRDPEFALGEVCRVLVQGGSFIGQTSQLEPYHSLSLWNFTVPGWKRLVEAAGLTLVSIRPSIDAFTLIERAYKGRPAEYTKYFSVESPRNCEIEKAMTGETRGPAAINAAKLLWCGQFSFECRRPD